MSRILLVEDELHSALPVISTLRQRGHVVEWAPNAARALEIASWFAPELLLCDVDLAGGPDGLDVIRQVAVERPSIRAVVLTGMPRDHVRHRIGSLPVDKVIRKPSSLASISRAVEKAIVGRSTHRGD